MYDLYIAESKSRGYLFTADSMIIRFYTANPKKLKSNVVRFGRSRSFKVTLLPALTYSLPPKKKILELPSRQY